MPDARRFAPTLFGIVLTLVGLALFLRLGFWQLERAEQKAALVAQFNAGEQRTVRLSAANAEELPRYQQVRASGRFDSKRQILLDNMPSAQGRPGYRVLTPFELEDGGWVLVDRGWVAPGERRGVTPDVGVDEDRRVLNGRLDDLPRPGLRLEAPQIAPDAPWPRVLHFPQAAELERMLGRSLARPIVLLNEEEPDGFERAWRMHFRVEPQRHLAYAVQWFAFALVAVVLFLVMSFKRKDVGDQSST